MSDTNNAIADELVQFAAKYRSEAALFSGARHDTPGSAMATTLVDVAQELSERATELRESQ